MAKPNLQNSSEAQDTVFDNLGLDPADLGIGGDGDEALDSGFDEAHEGELGGDGDDLGDGLGEGRDRQQRQGDRQGQDRQQQRRQPDDLRVSHTRRDLPTDAAAKPDKKGNLVNAKGEIVARAGGEARLYNDREKIKRQLTSATAEVTDVTGRLNKAVGLAKDAYAELERRDAADAKLKQLGISPEDQLKAFQLYVDIKSKPAETLKRLLTNAAAGGITIDSLGPNAGVDVKSIIDAIRTELNPLREDQTRRSAEQEKEKTNREQLEKVQQEVQSFFNMNQDAIPYHPVFQRVLADPVQAHLSLGEIWARIQLNLERRKTEQRDRTPRRRGSMPNGRAAPPRGTTDMAPVSDTYDAILRNVLDEAGVS